MVNSISNTISSYTVDPQTGQLNAKETVPTGGMKSRVMAVGALRAFRVCRECHFE